MMSGPRVGTLCTCAITSFFVLVFGSPVEADLLLHYDFNDASDPAAVPDASGNGNDAEVLGAEYTGAGGGWTGRSGDLAMDFKEPGDNAHLNVLTAAAGAFDTINQNDAVTVALWAFGGDGQPHNNSAFWFSGEVEERVFQAHLPWSNGNVYLDVGGCCNADQRINGPTAAENFKGRWNHYAFVKDGTRTAVYQNGVLFLESSAEIASIAQDLITNVDFGSGIDGGNSYSGRLDDIYVFDNALSQDEIRSLARLGSVEPLLVYDFNDASDPAAVSDASGNGNNAEVLGAAYTEPGAGWTGGEDDRAMDFQGANDDVLINVLTASAGAFESINQNDAATVALWAFGGDAHPHNSSAFWFSGDVEERVLQAHLPWSNSNIYFDVAGCCNADQRINGPTAEENFKGRWNHYVFVKDGTRTAVYQNGELFLESSPDVEVLSLETLPITSVVFGAGVGGVNSYNGLLDDIRVYDRALSVGELRALGGFGQELRISPAEKQIRVGEELQLAVTHVTADGIETDQTAGDTGTTYASDPEGVVSISGDGLVTALAAGETTVTATNGDLSASSAITVLEPLPPPELLLWYDFNNASNPALVLDRSGNGNNAEVLGAAYTDDGGGRTGAAGDRAMDFVEPGDNAHLNVLTAAEGAFDSINANDSATVAMWVYGGPSQPHNNSAFWFSGPTEARVLQAHLPWSNSNIYFDVGGCCNADQRINAATEEQLFKGQWNHYAFVKEERKRIAIYQNGELFLQSGGEVGSIVEDLITNVDFGSATDGENSYSGFLDDIGVWDGALSQEEIMEVMASGPVLPEGRSLGGDCNGDGSADIGDVICMVNSLFTGFNLLSSSPPNLPCATDEGNQAILDVNGDGAVDAADIVGLANVLFVGGGPPGGLTCQMVDGCPQSDCQ